MTDPRLDEVNALEGLNHFLGIKVVQWDSTVGIATYTPSDMHSNDVGLVHGGSMMSLLDVALSLPGSYEDPPLKLIPGLTLTLNTNFVSPARPGDGALTATGRRTGGGKSIFFAEGEIRAEDGRVVATATGVFKRGRQPE